MPHCHIPPLEWSATCGELRLLWKRWEARGQLIDLDLARAYFRPTAGISKGSAMDFDSIRRLIRNGQSHRIGLASQAGASALERACLRSGGHTYGDAYDDRSQFQVENGAPPHVVRVCWKCHHRKQSEPDLFYQGTPIYFDGDMP